MKRTTLLALILAAAAVMPARADLVSLSLSSDPVLSGDTFTLVVKLTDLGGDSVVAFGMNPFISDPIKAEFLSASVDPAFNDDSPFFGGNPAIAGDVFPPLSTTPLTLATLTFRALEPGPVSIGITSNLSNPNQGLFLLGSVQDLTASTSLDIIPGPATVPEPSTMAAIAFCLGGLYLRFRKRR